MAKKKNNIKEINLTPISNNMITTAYLVDTKSSILTNDAPTFLSVQQVIAIGPRVEDVKVGDWVYLDFSRYIKHVKTKSTIKAGIGGQEMIKEEFVPPLFVAPGDDGAYFKITDREIEGVIKDHARLPDDLRKHITIEVYEARKKQMEKEAEEGRKKFLKESGKKDIGDDKQDMPAVFVEGKFRG